MQIEPRLTVKEAAAHLGKSPSWLYHNRSRLGIRAHKIGGCWQFSRADLDKYIEATAVVEVVTPVVDENRSNKIILVAS